MHSFAPNLTALLDSVQAEYQLPGFDCAVWQHGKEIYRYMKGVADCATQAPITSSTLYNLYSNTKVIACVAALQLYERGLFLL